MRQEKLTTAKVNYHRQDMNAYHDPVACSAYTVMTVRQDHREGIDLILFFMFVILK